jgi:hypothetical protein
MFKNFFEYVTFPQPMVFYIGLLSPPTTVAPIGRSPLRQVLKKAITLLQVEAESFLVLTTIVTTEVILIPAHNLCFPASL